jgi:hypothetical protein
MQARRSRSHRVERNVNELRHRRDALDDAIALERDFAWRRTAARLNAVGSTA